MTARALMLDNSIINIPVMVLESEEKVVAKISRDQLPENINYIDFLYDVFYDDVF